jgi:glycosyltransferase involved in cell wall biosynthesis
MRILHVINSLEGGGAERLVSELLPILKDQNIYVELLVLSSNNPVFESHLTKDDIKLTYLYRSKPYITPITVWRLKGYFKGFDIIHSHLFPAQYLVVFAAALLGKRAKLITTEHSTNNRRRNYSILKPLEQFVYSYYDKVVSISVATQVTLQRCLGVKHTEKFTVIENGINIGQFANSTTYDKLTISPKIKPDSRLIIMAAGFNEAKDQGTLIRALYQLPKEYFLILAGEGRNRRLYENLVHKLKLDDRVYFAGFRSDIENLLKSADVSVLSSNWDGFGLSAIEAMAAGIPIIASNVEGLRECVSGAGILFEKGNATELANHVIKLFDDMAFRQQVLEKQNIRLKKYSIERMASDYKALYNNLILRY